MYHKRRSYHGSLIVGTTEGKYAVERPDTELDAMNSRGDEITKQNRSTLNPLNGFQSAEHPAKISPAG